MTKGDRHMSDNAPITGELRSWAARKLASWKIAREEYDEAEHLCDAIDAIHANLERENESLRRELDRARGEWDFWESTHVELPKDAGDEYICAGDKLDGYGKTIEAVELRYGRSGWVLISRDGNAYADTFAFTHHHAPTVEDVLLEFAGECLTYATCVEDHEVTDAIERFAAKLRLAGDAE